MSLILNQNIYVRVVIIQPINDFKDKYMVPVYSESFKTPSFTSQTLLNFKLRIFFKFWKFLISTRILNFFWMTKNKSLTLTF